MLTQYPDRVSAEGSFRVTSDNFNDALNDKESDEFRAMEQKYSAKVSGWKATVVTTLILGKVFHLKETYCNFQVTITFPLQIDATYQNSALSEAFVETVITGFSEGSLVVSFEVIFDQRLI